VEIDDRDIGGRAWDWIKKGVPIRLEVGPRDMDENAVFMGLRNTEGHKKQSMPRDEFVASVPDILDSMSDAMFEKALAHRKENIKDINSKDDFYAFFTPENKDTPEMHGGFAKSHWCGSDECEAQIKQDLSVTIRLIPFDREDEPGTCVYCGKPATGRLSLQRHTNKPMKNAICGVALYPSSLRRKKTTPHLLDQVQRYLVVTKIRQGHGYSRYLKPVYRPPCISSFFKNL